MIIDGKKIANDIQTEIRNKISSCSARPPCLAVILVGNNPASLMYIERKTLACQSVGMDSMRLSFPETITEEQLIEEISQLNSNEQVDGILVQLPLPAHIHPHRITYRIAPEKDVDGFHPFNVGKMLIGEQDGFLPCTPLGIRVLLERSGIETKGKHIVVLGRSNIVGKPAAGLFMQNTSMGNATVTIVHSHSQNLKEICLAGDILIAAIGKPGFLTADMVKEGAVVIDVGTNKVADSLAKKGYRIVGDVDFENVQLKCSFITPVPGGVGPMTIAMLLQNTLLSYERKFHYK